MAVNNPSTGLEPLCADRAQHQSLLVPEANNRLPNQEGNALDASVHSGDIELELHVDTLNKMQVRQSTQISILTDRAEYTSKKNIEIFFPSDKKSRGRMEFPGRKTVLARCIFC